MAHGGIIGMCLRRSSTVGRDVDATLLCTRCAYDLRTLDPSGVCPECATPIADSLAAAADPLRNVRGPLRIAASVLLIAVALRVGFAVPWGFYHRRNPAFIAWAIGTAMNPWPLPELIDLLFWFGRADGLLALLILWFALSFTVQCAGVWLITGRVEPAGMSGLLRGTIRWVTLLPVVLWTVVPLLGLRPYLGLLAYAMTSDALMHAPAVAIALWTSLLWSRTRRLRGRPRSVALPVSATLITAAAVVVYLNQPTRVSPEAWLGAALNIIALLLLAWMWLALWQIGAAPRCEVKEAPVTIS